MILMLSAVYCGPNSATQCTPISSSYPDISNLFVGEYKDELVTYPIMYTVDPEFDNALLGLFCQALTSKDTRNKCISCQIIHAIQSEDSIITSFKSDCAEIDSQIHWSSESECPKKSSGIQEHIN
jgi:hypothetical protein